MEKDCNVFTVLSTATRNCPEASTAPEQDRVVFVADHSAGTITPYSFTVTTGALGAAGTPVSPSANGITQVSVDITGTYLYAGAKAAVAPGSLGAVAVYKIGEAPPTREP